MDPQIVSVISLSVAILSLLSSIILGLRNTRISRHAAVAAERSADAAEGSQGLSQRQLANSIAVQEAAAQPYIWADLRPRDDGGMLVFVVGNAGPTVATDVRITFQPSLESLVPDPELEDALRLEARARAGLRSIPPGRTFVWNMGAAHTYFSDQGKGPAPELKVTIEGSGPRGALETVSYYIALEDLRHQADRAVGVAVLEQPIKQIAEVLKSRRG